MTSFKSSLLLILALLSQPLAARAVVLEPSPEMTAALAEVFGSKVARNLIDLPASRFKGAPEYALSLATLVKEKEITLDEAKSRLLTVLNKLDQGATLDNMPNPEFAVVGVMPVGESVANRMVPGADAAAASAVASAEKPAEKSAESAEPAEPIAPTVSSAPSDQALDEQASAEQAPTEQASAEQAPAEPTLASPDAESSEKQPAAAPAEASAAEPTLDSGKRDLSSMGG
jgi:hypothetical protein